MLQQRGYEANSSASKYLAEFYTCNVKEVAERVDAAVVVWPRSQDYGAHYAIADRLLEHRKPVFVDCPHPNRLGETP